MAAPIIDSRYDTLLFRKGEKIPYAPNGENPIRVDTIYLLAYRDFELPKETIARERGIPLKTVEQAIEWCEVNEPILREITRKENKRVGLE